MRILGLLTMLLSALTLAACDNNNDHVLQGWVEADLIFVGPDEAGRVETLSVREGDAVDKGAPEGRAREVVFTSPVERSRR